MRQELTCALCIECSGWGALLSLDREPSHNGFNHRIMHEELRNNLDAPWISLPMFRDHMFNRAIADQSLPKNLSSDNDPLFRFHRWPANLRVLEIKEIKAVPCVPCSHPFIEWLIGTIRREYLNQVPFWNAIDLTRKLEEFRTHYNAHHVHRSLDGATLSQRCGEPTPTHAILDRYAWEGHCRQC